MGSELWGKSPELFNPFPESNRFYVPLWHGEMGGALFSTPDATRSIATRTGGVMDGAGFLCDGDDFIKILNNALFGAITPNLTVWAWINGGQQNFKGIFTQQNSGNTDVKFKMTTAAAAGAKFRLDISQDGTLGSEWKRYDSSVDVSDSTPHLIGFTFAAGTLSLYKDGVVDPNPTKVTDNAMTTLHTSTTPLGIGATNGNLTDLAAPYTGTIMECGIEAIAFTAGHWAHLFNETKGRHL